MKPKAKKEEFEFCKICNLNHDQGRRHIYFPNHTKSLSSFFFRLNKKLSDVRFFLDNPAHLLPEHASFNRIWCVFCDLDIDELGSFFVCSNAIKHFSSTNHLRSLKHFWWKYGCGMDCMDSYRISGEDLIKWEKQCKSLKVDAAISVDGSCKRLCAPSIDIHNKVKYSNFDNFEKEIIYSNKPGLSNSVVTPLLNNTNERYQISQSDLSTACSCQHNATSLPLVADSHGNSLSSKGMLVSRNSHGPDLCNGSSAAGYLGGAGVHQDALFKEHSNSHAMKEAEGNVNSGAPPPWLHASDEILQIFHSRPNSSKSGKSQDLNPRRVGAAWAEKRKVELEMLKRGEMVGDQFDDDWLPNFGRVWQSGTRKESRKEFESQKQKLPKDEIQADTAFDLQPYVSKRMRRNVLQ